MDQRLRALVLPFLVLVGVAAILLALLLPRNNSIVGRWFIINPIGRDRTTMEFTKDGRLRVSTVPPGPIPFIEYRYREVKPRVLEVDGGHGWIERFEYRIVRGKLFRVMADGSTPGEGMQRE